MTRRQCGFTLLEILVSMVILAVMGLMAYRAVSEARVSVDNAEGHLGRLREVQRAVQVITTDFRNLTRRPVRESIGDGTRATLLRDPNASSLVELSHAGWPNGAGTPRGTVMDPTLASPPVRRELLDRVESVEIRYMNSGREWVTEWPPLNTTGDRGFYARPLAVEVTLLLSDYGEIRRLVEVSG
jgi:general secretion pathway protein J